jgi:hypothetical protein
MTRFVSLFLGLLALTSLSFGQMTIHNTDFAPVGTTYTIGSSDTNATFNLGSAGANQTWTFTNNTWTSVEQHSVLNPSSTPYAASFPTANRAELSHTSDGDIYQYELLTASSLAELGTGTVDTVIVFPANFNVISLPVTYQSAWTSVNHIESSMGGITVLTSDSVIQTVDGWGTVVTPYGSYPCLRVFSHVFVTMSMQGIPIMSFSFYAYSWADQQARMIVTCTSRMNASSPTFTSGTIDILGAPLAAEPERGPVANRFEVGQNYPNPFNPTTTIPVTLDHNSNVSLDIYDITGQLISHESSDMPAGTHEFSVNGARWASGLYFARVTAGEQSRVMKMQLLK